MKLKVINKSNNQLPKYKTKGSAGMDLQANLEFEINLRPGARTLVPTGIYLQLPQGYEAQVRPRSGLAFNSGITVLNSPGTIDSDYTGEIKVILINHSTTDYTINNGDRIAQLVIAKYEQLDFEEVEVLEETDRGVGGFGSTGL